VGLVASEIERAGIPTLCLSNIPDLTAAVGVPRLAALEHPFGRTVGQPGDADGQLTVLRETFGALGEMQHPGTVVHLPFEWPEPLSRARAHPSPPPPIATYLKKRPWEFPKLVTRKISD
jgi:hypothetical protein